MVAANLSQLSLPPLSSFVAPWLLTFPKSPHQYHSMRLTLPLFSYSYTLFCTARSAISNRFITFHTLCRKHRGVYQVTRQAGCRLLAQSGRGESIFRNPAPTQRRPSRTHSPKMLKYFQGATRFRRKLSRPEGMPGPTCP